MADSLSGMPTAAVLISYCDGLATMFKTNRAAFDTLLTSAQTFRGLVSTIGHDQLEQQTQLHRNNKVQLARYESYWKGTDFSLIQDLQNIITASLPSGWSLGTQLPLDGWLTRINGTSGVVAPAAPIVLTAATTPGGALSTVAAGSAPRVVFTHVGSNDMQESLISAESTQVALTGGQNSYTGTIAGTVPTGVTKIRIYRGLPGGATGTYYLAQTVNVTAGLAYPSVTIQIPDAFLATTIIPPSWMSCPMTPEFAYLFGLSTATSSPVKGSDTAPFQLTTQGMMSANNVALAPSTGWIGIGNQISSARFGTHDVSTTYLAGAIQTANVSANNAQGFVGSVNGLQVRASTQLNGTYTPTITYTYLDATHSTPQTQTAVATTAAFAGSIANETKVFSIPAGRVILSVTETSKTGTATTGVLVYEGVFPRSY